MSWPLYKSLQLPSKLYDTTDVINDAYLGLTWLWTHQLDMVEWVRIFPTQPEKYPIQTRFFFFFYMKQKQVDSWPDPWFFAGQPDPNPNPNQNHLKKFFFFGVKKKIVKLRQYWFNCLLWGLRKQLIHLHNCMQINWKINGWAFCNK